MQLIHGIHVKPLKIIADERGYLMEMLRSDDSFFQGFGQAYVSVAYPGVVKGWHFHKIQTGSPTKGLLNEFFMGEKNPILVTIPPGVVHGMKGIGTEPAMLVNVPTELYRYDKPDEYRIDPHKNDIPYNWDRNDG